MLMRRSVIFSWFGLLVFGIQVVSAQQNYGVAQGRLAEGIKEVAVTGKLMLQKVGTSLNMTVPVSLNGSKSTWWIVDTGSPGCLIDPPFSAKLGLKTSGQIRTVGGSFPVAAISDFQIGNFHCNEVPCLVRSIDMLRSLALRNETGSFEKTGLIGVNLLRKYGALVNCRSQAVFFSPTGNLGLSRQKYEAMGFTYVPMNVTPSNRLEVTGTLGGKEFSFALDTGSYSTMLDDSIRNEVQLPFFETNGQVTAPFANISKFARYSYGTVTDFKLGNYDAKGARLGSTLLNWKEAGFSHRFAGFIGIDFLFFRSALIDVGGRALYLKPYSAPQ
jgi:hypothetical protein